MDPQRELQSVCSSKVRASKYPASKPGGHSRHVEEIKEVCHCRAVIERLVRMRKPEENWEHAPSKLNRDVLGDFMVDAPVFR